MSISCSNDGFITACHSHILVPFIAQFFLSFSCYGNMESNLGFVWCLLSSFDSYIYLSRNRTFFFDDDSVNRAMDVGVVQYIIPWVLALTRGCTRVYPESSSDRYLPSVTASRRNQYQPRHPVLILSWQNRDRMVGNNTDTGKSQYNLLLTMTTNDAKVIVV